MEHNVVVTLLVLGGVALALAPVYWLLPSPRQKQLARLRAHALTLGLRPMQQSVPSVLRHCGYPQTMMKYQWFQPREQWPADGPKWMAFFDPEAGDGGCFVWLRSGRYSVGPDKLLADLRIADFPRSLGAVEADSVGVGFYWHEAGDNSEINGLYDALKSWPAAYRAAVDVVD